MPPKNGKLSVLSGVGPKMETNIIEGIDALARRTDRVRVSTALKAATPILSALLELPEALHGDVGGSLRRMRETIGDVDLIIASNNAEPIMQAFVDRPEVARILGHGPAKSSVELHNGLQIDLRVGPPERYGTLIAYFTGSKEHNVRLRELALARGLSLNEHAFTPTDGSDEILCATEEDLYEVLGLPWIPPEMREDRGEIAAAQAGELPKLITLDDMRGDLQTHSTWSDGKFTMLEMAQAAMERGYEYLLVTDHSYSLGVTQGINVDDIPQQRAEIDEANAELGGAFTVLHGVEVEIRADGTLDFDDETLATFDIVQASLHTSLRQPREQATERLLNAIRSPNVDIIGHPRGRLIPDREPADLDMDAVFAAALEHDTAMEINANPHRLDLDGQHARHAAEMGIKLTISTDAHSIPELDNMRFGVATAARGWVTADQVINTWSLDRLMDWVRGRRSL